MGQIKIIDLHIGPHQVPVPVGLEEVLNDGNCWSTNKCNPSDKYDREVVLRGDKLLTVYKYKEAK